MRHAPKILFAALVALACEKPVEPLAKKAPTPPVHVQTVTLEEAPMPEYLTLTGTLTGDEESQVAADVTGQVVETLVDRGSVVKKGDVLARVDSRSFALTKDAAEAQSGLARSKLELTRRECARFERLYKHGVITQADYERQTAQCSIDQFSAQAASAQQGLAAKSLSDSVIRAPFTGVIGERFVSVGQYVQTSTQVVSLFSTDPLRLSLTVPEGYLGSVKMGMPVRFRVPAFGEREFEAKVRFISPNVRVASRDLVVEAVAANEDGALKPGMFATAELLIGQRPVVVAPLEAVRFDEGVARVFAVTDGQIVERVVQLGEKDAGKVALLQGASAGEALVVRPSADVKDGARVE
jgi:membrane fusion protein (multidrug efflux system)